MCALFRVASLGGRSFPDVLFFYFFSKSSIHSGEKMSPPPPSPVAFQVEGGVSHLTYQGSPRAKKLQAPLHPRRPAPYRDIFRYKYQTGREMEKAREQDKGAQELSDKDFDAFSALLRGLTNRCDRGFQKKI